MKAVLTSIQPYYVFLIIARAMGWKVEQEKTVEIRKSFPKASDWDRKSLIYCSQERRSFNRIPKEWRSLMAPLLGKVIGEFMCDEIWKIAVDLRRARPTVSDACLTAKELETYRGYKDAYGWNISDLKIYDKPKELREFERPCINLDEYAGETYCDCNGCELAGDSDFGAVACDRRIARPPQSWMYVEARRTS